LSSFLEIAQQFPVKGNQSKKLLRITISRKIFLLEKGQKNNIVGRRYECVIPGLGLVQEVDWWTINAPKIMQSTDITNAPVPIPSAIFLLGSGLIGLAGFGRRKK